MTRLFLLFIFLFSSTLTLTAQETSTREEEQPMRFEDMEILNTSGNVITKNTAEIKGNPYLHKEFRRGYLLLSSGTRSEDTEIRYKADDYSVQITDGNKMLELFPELIDGFILYDDNDGRKRTYIKGLSFPKENLIPEQYVELLFDGEKVKLYKRIKARLLKSQSRDYYSGKNIDTFVKDTDYFMVDRNGYFHRIKLKKKDILNRLSDKKKEVQNFAKKNKLKYKREDDVRMIFSRYENL